jgi:hypothetical protein
MVERLLLVDYLELTLEKLAFGVPLLSVQHQTLMYVKLSQESVLQHRVIYTQLQEHVITFQEPVLPKVQIVQHTIIQLEHPQIPNQLIVRNLSIPLASIVPGKQLEQVLPALLHLPHVLDGVV